MTPSRLIELEEFFADPVFANASISPDGKRLAYVAPAHGRLNVWVRGIEEEHEQAVCVTHDARRGVKSYFWTDDPRWLLYLQDTDGNEDWHLFRVDLDDLEAPPVDLTPVPVGVHVVGAPQRLRSYPGQVLVQINKRSTYVDAFRIEIATGETVLHREAPAETTRYVFGSGGDVYATGMAEDGTYQFFAVDGETGEERLIYSAPGDDFPLGLAPVEVTPDGKALLIGGYPEGSDDLALLRVDGETAEVTVVAALPGHSLCTSTGLDPSGTLKSRRTGELIAHRFVGDRPIIHIVDPDYADVFAALAGLSDGVLATLSSDEEERRWVATFFHDTDPAVAYLYDRDTGENRLLGRPYAQFGPGDLAPTQTVHFPARDGLPLTAFLTLPNGVEPKNLPLVLFVHGGPWVHDAWANYAQFRCQFFANRGYAVLQVNYRGSSGYGKRHMHASIGEWAPGKMHDDLIDTCDWAVAQGIADRDRIGIFGGSYGGYSALAGVTYTPDYFAAAVDYCGISSLPNFMRTVPPLWWSTIMKNSFVRHIGDPDTPEGEAALLASSPITLVDRITTPLLVAQGAMDVRVVQAESDNIVESLRARGVEVEYLLAEDEGHGFQNHENVVALFRAIETFFGAHLGGRTSDLEVSA